MLHSNFKIVPLSVLCSLWFATLVLARFPDDPKPCAYGDSECLIKKMNYFLHEKYQGDSSINLIKLDPLRVPKISLKQGAGSVARIDLDFTDNTILGLSTSQIYKVKGFGRNPADKHMMRLKIKEVIMLSDYKIDSQLLILSIKGHGKSNMTAVDCDAFVRFTGVPYEKEGATYMSITNFKISVSPGRAYYRFDNLFNGDKVLSDNMNKFMNENWREVWREAQESLELAMAKVYSAIVNNVFSKYPYEKFFL